MKRNLAVFILTHGRADNVMSYKTVRKCGWDGPIYLLVDNEDSQIDRYKELYGDEVIVFNKTEYAKQVDACDNYDKRNSIVYARNYNFVVARELGITHFWQLDDDYNEFHWSADNEGNYLTTMKQYKLKHLDKVLHAMAQFLDETPVKSIAMAQGGDFIGGEGSQVHTKYTSGQFSRKAMNSFMFRADRPVTFRGRVNDDVNLYVEAGRRGDIFITHPRLRVQQPQTQQESGGCTDIYLALGTYIKSMYSLLVAPSCIRISMMGVAHRRIHHRVLWPYTAPRIIDEGYRKQA